MISNLVFIGTPQFSVPTLEKLIINGFIPKLVITQPDKTKGRNKQLAIPEIKECALRFNIPIHQPLNINDSETIELLKLLKPDIIITVSYGGFIGKDIRKIPSYGVLNIHPSLLPVYRGSTPIQTALKNGDMETGITIFKITAKMDTGPILFQKRYPLNNTLNFSELEDFLSRQSAEDMYHLIQFINSVEDIEQYNSLFISQNTENAVYTEKVTRETNKIDWNKTAFKIYNFIRSLADYPGAISFYRNKQLKLIQSEITQNKSEYPPGMISSIIKNIGFTVSTNDFDLLIKKVQPEGKKIMSAHDFNIGARLSIQEGFTNGL